MMWRTHRIRMRFFKLFLIIIAAVILLVTTTLTYSQELESALHSASTKIEVDGNILYKYGYISENGAWGIPPVFDDTDSGSTTALQPTSIGYLYTAKKGNKWGFVNSMGNWIIDPIYDDVSDFHADRSYVLINGHNAFIDPKGKEIITFHNGMIAEQFCEEISVYYRTGSDTYTFIDINGNILFVLDEVQSLISDHYGYYKLCSEGMIQVKKK